MKITKIRQNTILLLPFIVLGVASCSSSSVTKYKLSFDPNGGNLSQESILVEEGKTANLPTPTKSGKTFIGWYTGWNKNDYKVTDSTVIKKDLNLIARWNTYDITFLNGDNSVFKNETVNYNKKVQEPQETPSKAKDDAHPYFEKWDFDFDNLINSDISINSIWSDEMCYQARYRYISMYDVNHKEIFFTARFKDSYLNIPSTEFSGDLAMFNFFASMSTGSVSDIENYYTPLGFDDICSFGYSQEETAHTISYAFAHKKLNNKTDLVSIVVRGVGYGREWADNFTIGKEGHHQGFNDNSLKIIPELNSYISKYDTSNIKIMLAGYSRAGGVANLLANNLLITKGVYSTDNLYVYTYEAPMGVKKESAIEYPNVFNIMNSADLVPAVAPDYYGFKRCGVDVDIYQNNIDDLIFKFDPDIKIDKFSPDKLYYPTEPEYVKYLIKLLTAPQEKEGTSISTREEFVDHIQEPICYALNLVFSLKSSTLEEIMSQFSGDSSALIRILAIMSSDYGLYEFLNPYIQNDGVEYDENELKENCYIIRNFLMEGPGSSLISQISRFPRMATMHMMEIDYILLKNYLLNK